MDELSLLDRRCRAVEDEPAQTEDDEPVGEIEGDAEVRAEGKVLIRSRDSVRLRVTRALEVHRLALNRDAPGVGLRRTAQHPDHGALACSVVADETDDFAGAHRETDVLHREDGS